MTPRRHRENPGMGRRILAATIATALAASLAGTASAAEPTGGPMPAPTTSETTDGTTDGTTCTTDETTTWTTSTGATLAWNAADKAWEAATAGDTTSADPITATATPDTCPSVTLTAGDATQGTPRATRPGVATTPVSRTWTGTDTNGGTLRLTLTGETTTGKDVTLADGDTTHAFTQDTDGTWRASAAIALTTSDDPDLSTIAPDGHLTLSDGTTLPVTAADFTAPATTTDGNGTEWVTRTAALHTTVTEPTTGTGTPVTIALTASRTRDTHVTLGVLRTTGDGTTETIPIPGWDEDTTSYRVTLPHDEAADQYTLATSAGPDATVGQAAGRLGDASSRILTIDANGRTYTVTIGFQAADIQADSPAKLTGIYVNRSGESSQGQLVDGWDPNRLAYTVTVAADAPSPYVLPVAPDGVTVASAGSTQTSDATTQSWKVTDTATGASRTYSVTVARAHKPTAAESFTPSRPDERPAAQAAAPGDATPDSIGWTDKDGTYHPETATAYTIGEGGRFAYRLHDGQSASVAASRTGGMTWKYTLSILAADGHTFSARTVAVTFVTAATHTAELTGIAVNGRPLDGFDPAATEYTVTEPNAPGWDEWTVAALWDRTTGMTVTVDKDADQATITVTSADGLVTRTYTVRHSKGALAAKAAAALAHTGVAVIPMAAAALALAAAGSIPGVLRIARRRHERHAK